MALRAVTLACVLSGPRGKTENTISLASGKRCADFRDNRLDAGEHILSLIRGESLAWIVGVVGADHQGDQLGGNTIQGTVLNTPKHVLGAVPGKSEVKHLAIRKGCLVVLLALPVVGDRVADHHQVKVALLRLSEFCVVAFGHEFFQLRWHGHDGGWLLTGDRFLACRSASATCQRLDHKVIDITELLRLIVILDHQLHLVVAHFGGLFLELRPKHRMMNAVVDRFCRHGHVEPGDRIQETKEGRPC